MIVLWQLDTGKKQYLPHLGATITNLVVSPTGQHYGVQLADNSAMVLSTAELKPVASVAGIQSCVISLGESLASQVKRVSEQVSVSPIIPRTPAVIHPQDASRLLLAVGQQQTIDAKTTIDGGNPFLQTFDLASGHNISRQPLTRSNITNVNITPAADAVSEPRVSHLCISKDGDWLATVDQWTPPSKDLAAFSEDLERREVYLKFWQWHVKTNSWSLVSRIDAPHAHDLDEGAVGQLADLIADPQALQFATIGEDNIVRTWVTKTRKIDNVIVRDQEGKPQRHWICRHAIPLEQADLSETEQDRPSDFYACLAFSQDSSLLAAASSVSADIHLIESSSGHVRSTIPNLTHGSRIIKLGLLSQYLIVLSSERLVVYDVVSEMILYGIELSAEYDKLSQAQMDAMFHLAVNPTSHSFALALPSSSFCHLSSLFTDGRQKQPSLLGQKSELYVYSVKQQQPLLRKALPTMATALLANSSTGQYIVLDTAAEIHTVSQQSSVPTTVSSRSIAALQLDSQQDENEGQVATVEDDADVMELDSDVDDASVNDAEQVDDAQTRVVSKEALAAVFDLAPAFAMPALEDVFYKVVSLWDETGHAA